MKRVWVIEMLIGKKWEPTIGAGLTKKDAKMFMRGDWIRTCPNDKFRVRKYVPKPNLMICPCCGEPWDTKKYNACQCGAVLMVIQRVGNR